MPTLGDLLDPGARERLLERMAELEAIDRLVRERGQQQPPDPPPTLAKLGTTARMTA
jgi:hypothetical protein